MAEPRTPALEPNPLNVPPDALRPYRDLEREASGCTRCALSESRTKVVFGEGPLDADLFILGTAPGRHEDVQGTPFLGAAGNVLTNSLAAVGLAREDCYVTNLVKCRPPSGRSPLPAELEACSGYLFQQIAHVRPKVILALGELPTAFLLRRRLPLAKVAGYRLDVFDGVTLVPTYDPVSAVKGNTQAMAAIRRDVGVAKAVLDGRLATGAEAMADVLARRSEGDDG